MGVLRWTARPLSKSIPSKIIAHVSSHSTTATRDVSRNVPLPASQDYVSSVSRTGRGLTGCDHHHPDYGSIPHVDIDIERGRPVSQSGVER